MSWFGRSDRAQVESAASGVTQRGEWHRFSPALRRGWAGLMVTLGAVFVAPLGAQPLALTDDRGVRITWAELPQRVVSLLPSLTESLCALGGCARLVGTDRYSNWPVAVASLPKLGGLEDAVIERIVTLRPDVVLASSSTRAVARLEGLGLKVLAFDSDRHEQVRSSLDRLAVLLGEPARAKALWQSLEAEVQRAAQEVPAAWRGRKVYFETDSTPYAAGASSFIGQTLMQLGLVNIVSADMGAFPRLNPEFVVRSQPDLVIGVRHQVDLMAQRPGWRGLVALQKGRVCAFDAAGYEVLVRPGPRLGEAARAIARCVAALPPPG